MSKKVSKIKSLLLNILMGTANQHLAFRVSTNVQQTMEVSRTSISPTAVQETTGPIEEECATENTTVSVVRRT